VVTSRTSNISQFCEFGWYEWINIILYNMNIYFKVVEVQIQALEYIPKLRRNASHPGAVLEEPHPKDQGIENDHHS
jgi:hypothetical protein